MSEIPKIKKKIKAFLTKEDGKISKEKLLNSAIAIGGVAVMAASVSAGHSSHTSSAYSDVSAQTTEDSQMISGTHAHHSNHSSNHSSY
ncbi:MAG: hypothetical protein ACQER9_04915 [Nanobdellota archaeon]